MAGLYSLRSRSPSASSPKVTIPIAASLCSRNRLTVSFLCSTLGRAWAIPSSYKWRTTVNTLYNIAIIEGFLSQHADLPQPVRDSLNALKEEAQPKPR